MTSLATDRRPARDVTERSLVRWRKWAIPALVAAAATAAGCGWELPGGDRDGTVDRETFLVAYVDLRVAALQGPEEELGREDRDRILNEHGVTREDLLDFVEAHGRDVDFMKELWDEARQRIRAVDEELLEREVEERREREDAPEVRTPER